MTKETLVPFFQGIGSILEIFPSASCSVDERNFRLRPDRIGRKVPHAAAVAQTPANADPAAADWNALYGDWEAIGQDWRYAIDQVCGTSDDPR